MSSKLWSIKRARKAAVLVGVTMLSLLAISLMLRGAQIQAAGEGDPAITQLEFVTSLPDYDPFTPALNREFYFDNSNAGVITANLVFSGTPPLTVTLPAAFGLLQLTDTFTISPAALVLTYPVAITQSAQPGAVYVVENGSGLTATAVISYLQDITPPVTVLLSLPPGGLVVSATEPLVLTGTVQDGGSGVYQVEVSTGAGDWLPATLADSGPVLRETTWEYTWMAPITESVYTLNFRGTDNIGQVEVSQSYVVTVTDPSQVIAVDDLYSTPAREPLHVGESEGVLNNDIETRNRPLTAEWVNGPTHGSLTLSANGAFVYTPTNNFVGQDHFTYRAVNNRGQSDTAVVTIDVTAVTETIYLPVIMKPFEITGGAIQFGENERFAGVTTFVPEVELDFSSLQFSSLPDAMKVWVGVEPSDGWQDYSDDFTADLDNGTFGLQSVHARFQKGNATTSISSINVFYIPNGDFANNVTAGWTLAGTLPAQVSNGVLLLGNPAYPCTAVPEGYAGANINLHLPAGTHNYKLYVEGTINTQDRLPTTNPGEYDAFEIYVNANNPNDPPFYRNGNLNPPTNCSTWHDPDAVIGGSISLSDFHGLIPFRFENHTRFDNLYNTYTEIERIWVGP